VAPLGHPQHAPVLAGTRFRISWGARCGAGGPAIGAAIPCGPRRPRPSATRPMKSRETFTAVCGPFGAPPARTCFGRYAVPYLLGGSLRRWGARKWCRHSLRSASPARVRHPTNEITGNIHSRLWPLWGTPSTHLFWPVSDRLHDCLLVTLYAALSCLCVGCLPDGPRFR